MENVDRILKSKILFDAIKTFKEAGYGISYRVLDASYCGVPQKRKRFFMIGELNGQDGFLAQISSVFQSGNYHPSLFSFRRTASSNNLAIA